MTAMTEEDARAWVRDRFGVPRETLLARFVDILLAEAEQQNLISRSTFDSVWARHIVDSAQLLPLAQGADAMGTWLDIGTGAGLPGMVVALASDWHVAMVEPRKRRAAFLAETAESLGIASRVSVHASRIESYRMRAPAAVITARAVAELSVLLSSARHCADLSTLWLLPKGRGAQSEVEAARGAWQGSFHVESSITQPDSRIIVAREVRPR